MKIIFIERIKNYSGSHAYMQGVTFNFIASILSGIFYFFSLYFVSVLHIPIAQAGIILSFYGLGTIIGGLLAGKLSDHISPTFVSITSLFIQSATFLALTQFKLIPLLSINLFILGISTYGFITSNYIWTLNQCELEKHRLRAINSLSVASNLGIGLASLIIGVIDFHDFYFLFYFASASLASLAIFLVFQDKNNKRKASTIVSKKIDEKNILIKNNKNIFFVLICLFFTGMIVSQIGTTYPIYLNDSFPQLGVKAFSILFSTNVLLVVLFQQNIVNRLAAYNKFLLVGIGSFLIGIGMLTLNLSALFAAAFLSCVIYTLGEMIFFSIVQLYCYEKSEISHKGRSLGRYRTVYASSRFLGPALGGIIYRHFGGDSLWYISGFIGLTFLFLCSYYRKTA